MKIGLYGLPTAGKTTILNQVSCIPVFNGGDLLHQIAPNFSLLSEPEQCAIRKQLALSLQDSHFIMDGHYAFGERTVFTEEDGKLYDVFLYLHTNHEVLKKRMELSPKNEKYASFDIEKWQQTEIECLRSWCHSHEKDFYVLDNPPQNQFDDITEPLSFIQSIVKGYSCVEFARDCARKILASDNSPNIILTDGDRTLTKEDTSSAVFQYSTHLFDGNFYTGYQSWRQGRDFSSLHIDNTTRFPVHFSQEILRKMDSHSYLLTTGHPEIWTQLSSQINIPCFSGCQMSAETKHFVVKFLQDAGRMVTAYGDSLNDYYMLRQADNGYLVMRQDGRISRSLKNKDLGGLNYVRIKTE